MDRNFGVENFVDFFLNRSTNFLTETGRQNRKFSIAGIADII